MGLLNNMSFTGYYRKLCSNGHLWEEDVYGLDFCYCPHCGDTEIWHELVHTTNGLENSIVTKLKEEGYSEITCTDDIGNMYTKKITKYKIPHCNCKTQRVSSVNTNVTNISKKVLDKDFII